jgi:hypothetical protein
MAKITEVGGVFFKSMGDSAALAEWYRKHLGMPLEDFGGAIYRALGAESVGQQEQWYRIDALPSELWRQGADTTSRCR